MNISKKELNRIKCKERLKVFNAIERISYESGGVLSSSLRDDLMEYITKRRKKYRREIKEVI